MKKKLSIGIVVIAVIIIATASTFSNKENGQTPDTLKIGVIAPLTGDYGEIGENVLSGIKTAEAVYEKETGKQIEIIFEDDGADATKGLSAYQKFTTIDKVDGLINVFTSTMDAIYGSSETEDYPVMMEFFQANNVADDHVFQMTAGNEESWPRYAEYILESNFDQSNVVIVHSPDAAQVSFATSFGDVYKKQSNTIKTSLDKSGLRTDAAKIANLNPSMIILFMTPENGAILTKELLLLIDEDVQFVYDLQLVTGVSFYEDQLGGDLSKINGAINLIIGGASNQKFIEAYRELYNEEPPFLADHGYDTLIAYLETYDNEESVWTENLRNYEANGASGQIRFTKKGIRWPDLSIQKVINGKQETVSKLVF